MKDLLLVDDDGDLVVSLSRALSPHMQGLSLCGATNLRDALSMARVESPKVVVLDLCIDERVGVESGFEALVHLQRECRHARIIVLTGHGSVQHGVRALHMGASSFIEKPVEPEHLAALVRDAASQAQLRRDYEALSTQTSSPAGELLCGVSQPIQTLREKLSFIATTPQAVLIIGETGTGKGLCARIIHELSARRVHRFVHYQPNYGGADLVHSELFGHVRGAFTGATEARRGLVADADKGTLFIDELDETPLETQVRFLDLLQEKRMRALGSDSWQHVDCRFIAATNRNLEEALSSGKIRRDLHHRIGQCVLDIPPLRTRMEDVPHLAEMFLKRLREREGMNVFEISEDVIHELSSWPWEGNVRELQGVVETACYHANFKRKTVIDTADLCAVSKQGVRGTARAQGLSFNERVERFKAALIADALAKTGGNQVHAAKLLVLDRSTLRRALARTGALRASN